jgi:hypothetical protein
VPRRRPRWLFWAILLTGIAAIAVESVLGLAANTASAQAHWPGFLKVVQRHPWWVFLVTIAVLVLIFVLVQVLERRRSDSDAQSDVGRLRDLTKSNMRALATALTIEAPEGPVTVPRQVEPAILDADGNPAVMSQDIEDTPNPDQGSGFLRRRGGRGVPGGGPGGLPVGW